MIVLEDKLYTSDETASVIGVTSRTLYRYVKTGEITPETKTKSGTYRFERDEIYKYLYPDNYEEIIKQVKMVEQESTKYSTPGNEVNYTPRQTQDQNINQPIPAQSSTNNTQPNNLVGDKVDSEPLSSILEESPAPTPQSNFSDQNSATVPADSMEIDLDKELKNLENDLSGLNQSNDLEQNPIDNTPIENIQPSTEAPAQSSTTTDVTTVVEESPVALVTEPSGTISDPVESVSSLSDDPWNYYLAPNMGLVDIAKKLNELSKETGRKYAATMQGGLSLHKDIDEFFTIHFYVEADDLNWWVGQLGLVVSDKEKANVCLIPSAEVSIFKDAYKLRGLFVASDQKLIEDLMKNGEKELAKSLI